jgi:hypothetical protein
LGGESVLFAFQLLSGEGTLMAGAISIGQCINSPH